MESEMVNDDDEIFWGAVTERELAKIRSCSRRTTLPASIKRYATELEDHIEKTMEITTDSMQNLFISEVETKNEFSRLDTDVTIVPDSAEVSLEDDSLEAVTEDVKENDAEKIEDKQSVEEEDKEIFCWDETSLSLSNSNISDDVLESTSFQTANDHPDISDGTASYFSVLSNNVTLRKSKIHNCTASSIQNASLADLNVSTASYTVIEDELQDADRTQEQPNYEEMENELDEQQHDEQDEQEIVVTLKTDLVREVDDILEIDLKVNLLETTFTKSEEIEMNLEAKENEDERCESENLKPDLQEEEKLEIGTQALSPKIFCTRIDVEQQLMLQVPNEFKEMKLNTNDIQTSVGESLLYDPKNESDEDDEKENKGCQTSFWYVPVEREVQPSLSAIPRVSKLPPPKIFSRQLPSLTKSKQELQTPLNTKLKPSNVYPSSLNLPKFKTPQKAGILKTQSEERKKPTADYKPRFYKYNVVSPVAKYINESPITPLIRNVRSRSICENLKLKHPKPVSSTSTTLKSKRQVF